MTTTSEERKKDERVEEYLRLRKVWAKYVDGRKIDVWFAALRIAQA